MDKLQLLCIDDQREVLAALRKDLSSLSTYCTMIECESAEEAEEVLDEIDAEDKKLALIICDHVMPGKNGIDFLTEFKGDLRFIHTKKLLLTGLATHQDTIHAINEADIDFYIEKPWGEELMQAVKKLLTKFILRTGIAYEPYLEITDQETLYAELRGKV